MLDRNVRDVETVMACAGCYLKSAASVFIANANPAWTSGARIGESPFCLCLQNVTGPTHIFC